MTIDEALKAWREGVKSGAWDPQRLRTIQHRWSDAEQQRDELLIATGRIDVPDLVAEVRRLYALYEDLDRCLSVEPVIVDSPCPRCGSHRVVPDGRHCYNCGARADPYAGLRCTCAGAGTCGMCKWIIAVGQAEIADGE